MYQKERQNPLKPSCFVDLVMLVTPVVCLVKSVQIGRTGSQPIQPRPCLVLVLQAISSGCGRALSDIGGQLSLDSSLLCHCFSCKLD
jgi:hypothetical protein